MQKYLWSTVFLMLVTSVATYLAATYRNCPSGVAGQNTSILSQRPGSERVALQPLVLIPTQPPAFMIEPIEPITVEPEPRYEFPTLPPGTVVQVEARTTLTSLRMPYADEPSGTQPTPNDLLAANRPQADTATTDDAQTSWWNIINELIQQVLPLQGTDVEAADPGIEAPAESAPPEEADAAAPIKDYHNYHQDCCPYLHGGCTRGCPSFPPPAYRFDRQPPSEPMPTSSPENETK